MARIPNHLLPSDPKQRKALLRLQQNEVAQSATPISSVRRGGGSPAVPVVPVVRYDAMAIAGGDVIRAGVVPPVDHDVVAPMNLNIRPIGINRRGR